MKTNGKRIRHLLFLILVLSLATVPWGTCAFAEESAVSADVSNQISLIEANMPAMIQEDGESPWYYSVMDFDHNGRLEFFAASQHQVSRYTNLIIWEVSEDGTGLAECSVLKDSDESFPDIISDRADTFHDPESGTWFYLFYDNIVLSPAEVYTMMCSVTLKDGRVSYQPYAVEHSELVNSLRYVTHSDLNGFAISADQYTSLSKDAFTGLERTTTDFDWFRADEGTDSSRLMDSYEVFSGEKAAPETSPISEPAILHHDEMMPVQGASGDINAQYMIITKNPTSETKHEGQSLSFVANANVYDSAYWTFVSPDGGEYDLPFFQAHFVSSSIDGAYGPVLTISGIDGYMDGWGAYCTFYFKGQTAVTSTAWISVR